MSLRGKKTSPSTAPTRTLTTGLVVELLNDLLGLEISLERHLQEMLNEFAQSWPHNSQTYRSVAHNLRTLRAIILTYQKKFMVSPSLLTSRRKRGDQAGATLQNVIDGINGSVASQIAQWAPQPWDGKTSTASTPTTASMAAYYQIKFLAYEGGQHLIGSTAEGQVLNLAVQKTPEIGAAYEKYLKGWAAQGGDLFMHFVAVSGWSKYGYWGLQNDLRTPTPKSDAMKRVLIATAPPPVDPKDLEIANLKSIVRSLTNDNLQKETQIAALKASLQACETAQKETDAQAQALKVSLDQINVDLAAVKKKIQAVCE
jgi:hypothetical protein